MAWRIARSVVRGEVDNRTRGTVTGRIWLLGREEPLALNLAGNCCRDLAGFRFTFTNPDPQPDDPAGLQPMQQGRVGDITASRKVRDVPMEDIERLMSGTEVGGTSRYPLAHCFYLEWYSESNGRVVIESTKFRIELGEQAWVLDEEGGARRRAEDEKSLCSWLDDEADKPFDVHGEAPMDEFQWEKFMKESDARTEKYSQLLEKYMDDPDRDRIVAREMGWTWVEELMDAEEREGLADAMAGDPFGDMPDLVPNPLTEGTDWVRNEHGHVEHPLCLRARKVGMDLWQYAEERGLLNEHGDPDLQDMIFQAQMAGAKLAGALNHLAYDDDRDSGFLVAALKRALNYLHLSISLAEKVAGKKLMEEDRMKGYEQSLFAIREEILSLMKRYRDGLP